MEPGDKEQEQTHEAEEWHSPRATPRCSDEQEQTCEDGLPPGGVLVTPGTRSLALIYAGFVFVFGSLLRAFLGQQQQNPLVIVASTLVIAALFQPIRHGVQRVIDRRFYRRKYDAAQTLTAFSATLRNEVDLEQLREGMVAVVTETMQPSHISLWLPPAKPDRKQQTAWSSTPPAL